MHSPSVSTGMTGYSSDFKTNSEAGSDALTLADRSYDLRG
jgi:hypothetical protein